MKRALVTGGSGQIGTAICRQLAEEKLHVIVHANRNRAAGEEVANHIIRAGGSASVACFDVSDTQAIQRAIGQILEVGPVQVLVNNAGVYDDAPMAGMRADQWNHVIAVSLGGFFNVTQPLLLPMIGTRWGRIITISSVSAQLGNRGQTNYAAAKAGLHGASKSLALEVASRGITVNVVALGFIESRMVEQSCKPEKIEKLVPMKRAGTPQEVADLVGFLASEKAGYISGQVIGLNGGMA
ncbi:MAG TPA: 3-oxoacyl-ACP reductase FabG [Nitrospiraceae bacterium]|nr:3-oxoacyl-ACP reductase FabG [Nitrospiraceae bacterium]